MSLVAGVDGSVPVIPPSLVNLPIVRVHQHSAGVVQGSLVRQEGRGGGGGGPVDQKKAEHDNESHGEEDSTIEHVLPHTELPQHLQDVPPDLLQLPPAAAPGPVPVSVNHSPDLVGLTHRLLATEPAEGDQVTSALIGWNSELFIPVRFFMYCFP